MDPVILAMYTRHYSEIPHLQRPFSVDYMLCRTGGALRIVVRAVGVGKRAAVCELPGADVPCACGVLRYLYENAIPVEHIRDIVEGLPYREAAVPEEALACDRRTAY